MDVRARLAVVPVIALVLPLRCSLVAPLRDPRALAPTVAAPKQTEPPAPRDPGAAEPSAVTPKREEPAPRIASVPPPAAPQAPSGPAVTLPDEVIVKALDAGHQAFLACWARAQRSDAPPSEGKVRLHLEIDDEGKVTTVGCDSDSPALVRCLGVVGRQLAFPAPGRPAVVDLPLMFQ